MKVARVFLFGLPPPCVMAELPSFLFFAKVLLTHSSFLFADEGAGMDDLRENKKSELLTPTLLTWEVSHIYYFALAKTSTLDILTHTHRQTQKKCFQQIFFTDLDSICRERISSPHFTFKGFRRCFFFPPSF